MDRKEIEIKKQILEKQKKKIDYDLEILKLDLELSKIDDEELFEEISSEYNEENYVIDGGIQLASSQCTLYQNFHHIGNGILKGSGKRKGGGKIGLTAPQILLILDDYDNIPKKGYNKRAKWVKSKIGKYYHIDRLLYNYDKGKLTKALQEYIDECPLTFNQGQLITNPVIKG